MNLSEGHCSENISKKHTPQLIVEPKAGIGQFNSVGRRTSHRTAGKMQIQDEILILLSSASLHGYGIWSIVSEDYPEIRLNTLYRWMNDLEAKGLIEGSMEDGIRGPNRKVYELTPFGRQRVVIQIRTAVKLIVDIYRRYKLFSALHFSNILQLADSALPNRRVLIAPFNRFLDFEHDLIQILIDTMRGRRVDFIGQFPGMLNMHPKPRTLRGSTQDLPVKNESYGEIWLCGLPKKSSFGLSVEECKRALVKGGMLYLAIPFLISSDHVGSDLGTFINNTLVQVFPELGLMEFREIEPIMKKYFEDTGVLDCRIHVFWAKK